VGGRGFWSSYIQDHFDISGEVQPALLLLASLKPFTVISILEQELHLEGSVTVVVLYVKKLRL
jgi:hypothetical protein